MLHLTAKNFYTEVKLSPLPVVVMFYAVWCGKCAMMKPLAEDLESKYAGRIRFCEVEIDESAVLAAEYEANIVPTFVYFENGKALLIQKGMMGESTFEAQLQKIFRIS